MPARTNAQRFFLTYSQVPVDVALIEPLCDFLYALQPTPVYIEAAHEYHQDGGHHFHVVIGYTSRLQGPLTFFDWEGCHPNIQSVRPADLFNRRHYIRKGARTAEEQHTPKAHKDTACDYDYEPCVQGEPPEYNCDSTNGKLTWADLLSASTEAEFFDGVRTHFARDWVLNHDRILGFGKKWYGKAAPFEPNPDYNFLENAEVDAWIAEVKDKVCCVLEVAHATPLWERSKTLVFCGPTLLGKTAFIRHRLNSAGLRHGYFQRDWALDEWDNSVDVIVFDDVSFEFMKGRKQFWGCQRDFIIDDKFRTKRRIEGGLPLIFICNEEEFFENARSKKNAGNMVLGHLELDWYRQNSVVINVQNKLYVEN
uniref:Replication associated protein n=1 Tax=Marmot associated feces virus 2 TaxID=2800897 RepID=A0A7T7DFV1_9VIRU|nr:replication associated protein [Marmot associated feces virus 2]